MCARAHLCVAGRQPEFVGARILEAVQKQDTLVLLPWIMHLAIALQVCGRLPCCAGGPTQAWMGAGVVVSQLVVRQARFCCGARIP